MPIPILSDSAIFWHKKNTRGYNDAHSSVDRHTESNSYLPIDTKPCSLWSCTLLMLHKPRFFEFYLSITNRWMDGRMDGRTDKPSYRDARTHLKSCYPNIKQKFQGRNKILRKDPPFSIPGLLSFSFLGCCVCQLQTYSIWRKLLLQTRNGGSAAYYCH